MKIDKNIRNKKKELLDYFRGRANEILSELSGKFPETEFKEKSKEINHAMAQSRDNLINILLNTAQNKRWTNKEILESILIITYTSDVVMLETRNEVWEYEFMSFSRRIGELWEPFCKLCFQYPIKSIELFVPPLFSEVKKNLTNEIDTYIDGLKLKKEEKDRLRRYYEKVWGLVTSGEIKLECDLHFSDGTNKYIVDFKSGFGSNEKGNTNRLLLVGSIYSNIEDETYKCLIFVRSTDNNHYLDTLKNSGVWDTYCGKDTYERIKQFSGFDIHGWIMKNVDWLSDFSESMKKTITNNNLTEYLKW